MHDVRDALYAAKISHMHKAWHCSGRPLRSMGTICNQRGRQEPGAWLHHSGAFSERHHAHSWNPDLPICCWTPSSLRRSCRGRWRYGVWWPLAPTSAFRCMPLPLAYYDAYADDYPRI